MTTKNSKNVENPTLSTMLAKLDENAKGLLTIGLGRASQLVSIPIAEIDCAKEHNARLLGEFADGSGYNLEPLILSIKENGFVGNIEVYKNASTEGKNYRVKDGFRRILACIACGMTEILCLVYEDCDEKSDALFQLVRGVTGKPLTRLERGLKIAKLIEEGDENGNRYTQSEVARRLGMTPAEVSQAVMIGSMPEKVQNWLKNGKVAVAVAVETYRASKTDREFVASLGKALNEAEKSGKGKVVQKQKIPAPQTPAPVTPDASQTPAQVRGVLRNVGSKGDLILNPFGCGIHAASVKLAMDWIDQAAELPDVLCPKTSLGEVVRRKDILSHLKMLHAVLVRHA